MGIAVSLGVGVGIGEGGTVISGLTVTAGPTQARISMVVSIVSMQRHGARVALSVDLQKGIDLVKDCYLAGYYPGGRSNLRLVRIRRVKFGHLKSRVPFRINLIVNRSG